MTPTLPPPCPTSFNLTEYVLAAGQATPQKTALILADRGTQSLITYRDLTQSVLGTATGLKNAGVASGDRVILALGNTLDFPIAFLALIAMGAVPMPISSQLTALEVENLCQATGPDFAIVSPAFEDMPFPCPQLASVDLTAMRNLPATRPVMGDPNRPAYIIFTSGTGGVPKAVVHAHRAIWARRMMWDGWYDLRADDRMLHAGAFNWTFTLGTGLLDPWAIGATAIIPTHREISELWDIAETTQATMIAAAPGVFRKLNQIAPAAPLPCLRHGLTAGDALPDQTRDAWLAKTKTPLAQAFGMTECSTFLSSTPRLPTSMFPQPGRRVKITGEGLIAVHESDPGLMLGYLENRELNLPLKDGWFVTSDTGDQGDDGSIRFTGRNADMMNAGGFRVSPREVEMCLEAHPQIGEVAVGEVQIKPDVSIIAAFYVATGPVSADELQALVATSLARYKQPRGFVQVPSLPRSANGKIIRKDLQKYWRTENGHA